MGAFERQSVAAASQLIVTTELDEVDGDLSAGDLSLREAVGLANASAGAQTISFDASLAGSTIRLSHGTLQLTESVTINGLGDDLLTLEGIGFSRIFSIDDGSASVLSTAAIRDLTIRGGNAQMIGLDTADGGGIRVVEDITLQRSRITGNTAAGDGGGMYVLGAAGGTITIESNEFSDNQATLHGGGLSIGVSSVGSVLDNSFVSNSAVRHGGGLLAVALGGGTLTVQGTRMSGNDAVAGGGGYLVAVANSQLTFSRADIYDNDSTAAMATPSRGGGGLSLGASTGGQVRVLDSTIHDNDAVQRGRGGGFQ